MGCTAASCDVPYSASNGPLAAQTPSLRWRRWAAPVTVPKDAFQLDFVFSDGGDHWENNWVGGGHVSLGTGNGIRHPAGFFMV